MAILGGQVGYRLLRLIAPRTPSSSNQAVHDETGASLDRLFGDDFFETIKGKVVVDFGCGLGNESIEMARKGATKVIGLDIREDVLEQARQKAVLQGLEHRLSFTTKADELADVIISKDAFEHFDDPLEILKAMSKLLKPEGCILAAFGPTWLHPYGGHLFSVFPWSHLVFTEQSLIRWRSDFKSDGATRFSEVAGGLNRLTISRFEHIVADSPFSFEWLETVPIKGVPLLRARLLREMGSSIVRCKLKLKQPSA